MLIDHCHPTDHHLRTEFNAWKLKEVSLCEHGLHGRMAAPCLLHSFCMLRIGHSGLLYDHLVHQDRLCCLVVNESLDAEDPWSNNNIPLIGSDVSRQSEDSEISHDHYYCLRGLLDTVYSRYSHRDLFQSSSTHSILVGWRVANGLLNAKWSESVYLHYFQSSTKRLTDSRSHLGQDKLEEISTPTTTNRFDLVGLDCWNILSRQPLPSTSDK